MSFFSGEQALNFLKDNKGSSFENKFSHLKDGETRVVKVLGAGDLISTPTYSIYRSVNTFTPDPLPKLNKNGYVIDDPDNLTPFDVVSKYYREQSENFGDENSKLAYRYGIKHKFALGFYDLDEKNCIVIDFTKNQAQIVFGAIQANAKRLGNRAFEITKHNKGQIQINPVMPDELTDAQQKAFEEAPKEFDKKLFEDLYFKRDKAGMIEALVQDGVDVEKFGFDKPKEKEEKSNDNPFEESSGNVDLNDDDLPF